MKALAKSRGDILTWTATDSQQRPGMGLQALTDKGHNALTSCPLGAWRGHVLYVFGETPVSAVLRFCEQVGAVLVYS